MSHSIRILSVAESDLAEIVDYLAADNPKAAKAFLNSFDKRMKQLAENPRLGPYAKESSIKRLGYRYLVLDSYLIFYMLDSSDIVIHRVLHGARDYTSMFLTD